MAKKYLALKDDLAQINSSTLILSRGGSNLTLADVEVGTKIYIPETLNLQTVNKEYLLVEKRNGVASLLRKQVTESGRRIDNDGDAMFGNSELFSWLNGDFLTRFSSGILGNFIENDVMMQTASNGTVGNVKAKVAIPSVYEIKGDSSIYPILGNSNWSTIEGFNLDYLIATDSGYSARTYWLRDWYYVSSRLYRKINNSGNLTQSGGGGGSWNHTSDYVRPVVYLTIDAEIDSNNLLQSYGKTYTGTIEEIRDGDDFYKIKDIDGRISSNITYDNTISGMAATTVKGALDELKSDIPDDADALSYDNTISGMTATNVQDAIDEVVSDIPSAGEIASGDTGYATGGDVYDSLTYISNVDLVIKPSSGNTVSGLTLGTSIYIPENGSNVEYIVVEHYNNITTVLRKDLVYDAITASNNGQKIYKESSMFNYLNTTFKARFSSNIQTNFATKTFLTSNGDSPDSYTAQISIPSYGEMGGETTNRYSDWSTVLNSRIAYREGTAKEYWLSNVTSNTAYYFRTVDEVGGFTQAQYNYSRYVRPCIALNGQAKINDQNVLQPVTNKTYSGTIEDVQDGDYFYKIKDIDGRDADNITYDPTDSGLAATDVQAAIDEIASSGGGGITYDLTVAGTATGDCTTDTDWTGATWTANTSVSDMLTKIQAKGVIDINGALTKSWTSPTIGVSDVSYWHPQIFWCEIIPAATFSTLASSLGIQTDGTTDAIVVKAAGIGASGEYSVNFALIIGVLADGTTLIYPM